MENKEETEYNIPRRLLNYLSRKKKAWCYFPPNFCVPPTFTDHYCKFSWFIVDGCVIFEKVDDLPTELVASSASLSENRLQEMVS